MTAVAAPQNRFRLATAVSEDNVGLLTRYFCMNSGDGIQKTAVAAGASVDRRIIVIDVINY